MHIQRTESASIARELELLNEAISRRAAELYEENGLPSVLENWLAAERQLVQRPMVEMHECGPNFEVFVGMTGVEPDTIEVHVASQDLLIRAPNTPCPGVAAGVVGVVHFEDAMDPDSLNAEFADGRLRLRMSVVG